MLPTLDQTCSAQCRDLDRKDYTHLLWTTLAEFPGILLTIVTIEKLGRKKTMALEFILLTIALCFLFNCSSNRFLLTIILFFVRGLASGVFQVNKWYFVTKIVLTYCSSDREKHLKFEAEALEFAKIFSSLEQFIQTVIGQNAF